MTTESIDNQVMTSQDSTTSQTWVELLQHRAVTDGSRCAFVFLQNGEDETERMTYSELDRRARTIAARLQREVAVGTPILLLYPSGLEFIAALFGCFYAGMRAIPAYPPRSQRRPTDRLESIVIDSGAQLALTDSPTLSRVRPVLEGKASFELVRWIATDTIPETFASDWRDSSISSDFVALLQYTSGSTSSPKGVMVTHRNLLHNSALIEKSFAHENHHVFVSWLPLFHDMGLIGYIFQTVFVGNRCVLIPPEAFLMKPVRWLHAISRFRARTSGGPNFAYELCAHKITQQQKATLDLTSWEVAFCGAEPVRAETLDRFNKAFASCGFRREAFFPCYGLAEATLMVTGTRVEQPPVMQGFCAKALADKRVVPVADNSDATRTLVGCGRAWNGQQVIIVDSQTEKSCAPDQIGEICVKGASVATGYWEQPENTRDTFRFALADSGDGPFLRTGDLGFIHDGELFITGRSKDMMIVNGRNHFAEDIELTVEGAHPAIRPHGVAAFVVENNCEERPVVVAELDRHFVAELRKKRKAVNGTSHDVIRAIRMAVVQRHDLSLHDVRLVRQAAIPRTSSGKIQRSFCKRSFLNGTLRTIDEDSGHQGKTE